MKLRTFPLENSHQLSYLVEHNCFIARETERVVTRPGGGGYLTKFCTGGSAPRSNPLPFHIPFWQKRYPFYIPFIEKRYLFHIPILESLVLVFM